MKTFILFLPCLIYSFAFAEIHTNEIVLRIGEVIDFDSGFQKIATNDTTPDTTWRSKPKDSWFATAQSFCRFAKTDCYDFGFFYNGSIIDCGSAPAGENCTESLKSVYSPTCIYQFKKSNFFEDLDNPVDTADTTVFYKYRLQDESFWDESVVVDCSLSQGPVIYILAGKEYFYSYYFLITEKGNGCIFTILQRDTVSGYCEFNRYNALRIKYYLQTEGKMDFSSVADEIRERIVTATKKHYSPLKLNDAINTAPLQSTFDMLGRNMGTISTTTAIKIQKTRPQNARRVLVIK